LAARIVVIALGVIGVAVALGAVLLWPSGGKVDIPLPFQSAEGGSVTTERGTVTSNTLADCGSPAAGAVITARPAPGIPGAGTCVQAVIAIESGPNAGAGTMLEFSRGPGQPNLLPGQTIRVFRQMDPQGATVYRTLDMAVRGWWAVGVVSC